MIKTSKKIFFKVLCFLTAFAFIFGSFSSYCEEPTEEPTAEPAPTYPQLILNYPVPDGLVNFFYLWYYDEVNQTGEWVQAVVSTAADFDGFILTAPVGYQIKDCRGLGIRLYSSSRYLKSVLARFVLTCPAMYDDDLGAYVNQFYNPEFVNYYYWSEGKRYSQDVAYGYIGDQTNGSNDNMCLLDFTFYTNQVIRVDDNVSDGNLQINVFFECSYNQNIYVHFVDGFINVDTSTEAMVLSMRAMDYSTKDLKERSALESATIMLQQLTLLKQSDDPLNGLGIAQALAAVYNPVIDLAFSQGGVALYLIILLFLFLVVAVITKWLRRE